MNRIVAIGECMVELAPTPDPAQFRLGYAGDTLNTAWYLRRLMGAGDQVDYFTAVGRDEMSDQMVAFLNDEGIGTGPIQRHDDRTVGLYLIQLDEGERSFAYWRGQSAARAMLDTPAALATSLQSADTAYFSGISVAILPPEDRVQLLRVLAEFRAGGGQVIFDPNLRPRLWSNADEMTAAIMAAAAVSDIVLPSYEDEAEWFGDADTAATAARYAQAGCGLVIVKNGPGEILIQDGATFDRYQPPVVDPVVDTTAAGDSFNAGFIARLSSGGSASEAVRSGAATSARVIAAYGALVPI